MSAHISSTMAIARVLISHLTSDAIPSKYNKNKGKINCE